jgi:hypothetical protein
MEAGLRAVSIGTRYHLIRMTFYSYPQVTQTVGLELVSILHPTEVGLQSPQG